MRNFIVRASVLALLAGGTGLAIANSTGPPAIRTGAFKVQGKNAEPNCTLCHSGSALNDPSGSVRILDLPATYAPGETLSLRVQLEHTWNPLPPNPLRWGFQIQAVQASTGDRAGTWVLGANTPPDTFKIVAGSGVYASRRYLEHTRNAFHPKDPNGSTRFGELGPVVWNVRWLAPPGDSGKVYFFAAGNSANGDGVSVGSGDFIFTTAESIMGPSTVDVPGHPAPLRLRTALEPPYPNPMSKCTDLSFTITKGGLVDISIFDLKGRRVRTALHEFREAGTHGTFWDGRGDDRMFVKNGVYLIRLTGPDGRRSSQKVVLAR